MFILREFESMQNMPREVEAARTMSPNQFVKTMLTRRRIEIVTDEMTV